MFSPELKATSQEVGELLLAKKHVLTLAESCTGGLISALITNTAGSSAWFDSGLVTYSNQAKQDLLKVKETTLTQYGAVSEQVAMEMAIGALQQGRSTIAASITGIAGPDGGTDPKPVGTVCFAWTSDDLTSISKTYLFQGNREQIREQSTIALLFGLKDLLKQQL
jgi:nicotinamide-nucleotide amidase